MQYLIEKLNAKVIGDIEDAMHKRKIDWYQLADLYNQAADETRQKNAYDLHELISNGEITLVELSIIYSVLDKKILISDAPVSKLDLQMANEWASK